MPPAQTRVVVAMSGGVDSSVVAAMLHEEGYEVIGITLQLYDYGAAVGKKGACCAGQDIQDARNVAEKLGIPHYVLNYESAFKQSVMDDFADTYLAGSTPIPCVRCNQSVKFKDLLKTARDLGAHVMATGHYVQRVEKAGSAQLHRGVASDKDQSYFLFATTSDQLDFLRFPLGGMHKDATRALAAKYGLATADKPDSQDICFVPTGGYAQVIEKLRPGACDAGQIVDVEGNVLGEHRGIIHYTVGQRRGLGVSAEEALYVVKLDAIKKQVVVGPKSALAHSTFYLKDCNWLMDSAAIGHELQYVQVKMRSMQTPVEASLVMGENATAQVTLTLPYEGIAPGQACVVYQGARVLGGGWITQRHLEAVGVLYV
jgi:tRNA-uridine 2-sulfurtransferase